MDTVLLTRDLTTCFATLCKTELLTNFYVNVTVLITLPPHIIVFDFEAIQLYVITIFAVQPTVCSVE